MCAQTGAGLAPARPLAHARRRRPGRAQVVIRVLLADDHPLLRQGIRTVLEPVADICVVAEAANGQEALDRCDETPPDVVLMDIQMPGMDGVEATRRIHASHPQVAVLVLTVHDEPMLIQEAFKAGALGYLLKETASSSLAEAIRRVAQGEVVIYPSLVGKAVARPAAEEPALSARQREVLILVASGRSTKEIAQRLGLSVKTAETHRLHLMQKLGLHNPVELTKYALRHHLV